MIRAPAGVQVSGQTPSSTRRHPRFRLSLGTQRALQGYLFILPWIVGFVLFLAWPLIRSFLLSFNELEAVNINNVRFVGLANYQQAFFVDPRFFPILVEQIKQTLVNTPAILIFSLFVAMLANQRLFGIGLFRGIFFLPVVIGSAEVIQQLFSEGVGANTFGGNADVASFLLQFLGPTWAENVILVLGRMSLVLWASGVQILIFIAGLKSIGPTYYEAGRIDGATGWELFWKITVPLISPFVLLNIIYTVVDTFTNSFAVQGVVSQTTGQFTQQQGTTVLQYIQQTAFSGQFRLGYAAALGWIYFLVMFVVLMVVIWFMRNRVYYAGEK
ncbi:MAG: sugar ABC transporter permease [Chloroflexi bacterium]|nr:sugar ABC transporter permease [Chloroflexota bacterium]